MEYRIRYRSGDSNEQAETVVEAHNTAEAVVKFFHTHSRMRDAVPGRQIITSISQRFEYFP